MEGSLGSLEREVLAALRLRHDASARQILEDLHRRGVRVAYTTTSTILGRLYAKGMVERTRETCRGGERYVYHYVDFEHTYLTNLLQGVVNLFGPAGVVHLSEELQRLDTKEERELRRRLGL
jgi:predicted transcriptional regulator